MGLLVRFYLFSLLSPDMLIDIVLSTAESYMKLKNEKSKGTSKLHPSHIRVL